MQIPLPPSDNLYKFVAISGLVLIVTSLIAHSILRDEVNKYYWDFANFNRAQSQLALDRWLDGQDDVEMPTTDEAGAGFLSEYLDRLRIEDAQERLDKIGDRVRTEYLIARERQRNWKRLLILSGGLGFFMMLSGFYLWYERVQKLQDMILNRKAEESSKENRIESTP